MNPFRSAKELLPWSDAELSVLRQLIGLELPMTYIAQRLHRPPREVSRKAQMVAIADMLRCPATGLQPRLPS